MSEDTIPKTDDITNKDKKAEESFVNLHDLLRLLNRLLISLADEIGDNKHLGQVLILSYLILELFDDIAERL
jgi:hypothetical protein